MASGERRQRSAMNSFGAVEPIPARGRGGVLKKELDRADAIIESSAAFRLAWLRGCSRQESTGRVGEEAIPQGGTTTSPLVEPDVQISCIRLSRKLSPKAVRWPNEAQLSRAAKPRSQMRMVPHPRGWFFRRRTCVQAAFPSSYLDMFASRPLRSTVVTRFFAIVGRSDSR